MGDMTLSEDVASEQVNEFLDHYDIDLDMIGEDTKEIVRRVINRVKKAVMTGRVEFSSDGTVIQRLKNPSGKIDSITYSELSGRAKLEAEKIAGSKETARVYALLGALSGLGMNAIASLKGPDLVLAEYIGVVFSWA
jgi:hypothetical protein